jgi:hypothetical protein
MLRRRSVEAEIERVYRERFRAFVVVATAILDDPHAAYDTVQDAFARAIERRSSFRREGTVEASGAPYVGVIVTPGELGWTTPAFHGWVMHRICDRHLVCEPARITGRRSTRTRTVLTHRRTPADRPAPPLGRNTFVADGPQTIASSRCCR